MNKSEPDRVIGPYTGMVAEAFRQPAVLDRLARLPDILASPEAERLAEGRNRHWRVRGGGLDLHVKQFGREPAIRTWLGRPRGSKARRSWLAARQLEAGGVGTPRAVAFLERVADGRPRETCFVTEYASGRVSFGDELIRLYRDDPHCAKFMALLGCVAAGVRAMHAAGFQHNDLGNQNILLARDGADGWRDPLFIDLNRGRRRAALSARRRARDLSRIHLPSDLMRVFIEMVVDDVPSRELLCWERHYRRRYAWHARTRRLRHPLRERRNRRAAEDGSTYPAPRDLWIWDGRSAQAIAVMRPRDRNRHYPPGRHARQVMDTVRALPGVWREYRALLRRSFQVPVAMRGRIGLAIDPTPATLQRELALLAGLGPIPVLLRFYSHEGREGADFRETVVRQLRAAGHAVAVALVQDRAAVREPARWAAFADDVLVRVGDAVEAVEIGHAVNRVKWGVWGLDELAGLHAVLPALQRRYPHVRFTGPAAIDFEYPFLLSALRATPAGARWNGVSHHLYVDRRGAPENAQGRFATLEKCALGRAIARWSPASEDRFVVSEVNWPLAGTGVYSPVGSPYESPGPRTNDPSVSEDRYADYMIRYLCIALCSGFVDRVYWWRLAARGFGLVDLTDGVERIRPAYGMLQTFLEVCGDGEFVGRPATGCPAVHAFRFRRADGELVELRHATADVPAGDYPPRCEALHDAFGRPLEAPPASLPGRPIYLRGVAV